MGLLDSSASVIPRAPIQLPQTPTTPLWRTTAPQHLLPFVGRDDRIADQQEHLDFSTPSRLESEPARRSPL